MPYTASIGNWDQGLSTLGSALFPDPSKVAAAGYYGAEARRALLQGDVATQGINASNQALSMVPGSGIRYAPPTFRPGATPNGPMIMASPSNLPVQTSGGPQPPPVSSVFAPPGSQPPVPGATTDGGPAQPGSPNYIPPVQVANLAHTGTDPNPGGIGTSGQPADNASPAPNSGAPNAPTTTGSDGTVPNNDPLSATIHPSTFNPSGGGVKMAPPAAADGSPAPLSFNPALYTAMNVAAGRDAAQVNAASAAYIIEAEREGVLDAHTANRLLAGFGQTGPLQAETQITTTGMTQAGETGRERMRLGEQWKEFQAQPTMVTPGGPGTQPVYTTRGQATAGGQPAYDPNFSTQYNTPYTVAGPTPGSATVIRTGQLPVTGVQAAPPAATQERMAEPVPVINNDTGQLETPTYGDVVAANQKKPGTYTMAPDALKDMPREDASNIQTQVNIAMERAFPGAPKGWHNITTERNEPARAGPEANAWLVARTAQLMKTSPNPAYRNPTTAAMAAINEGQQGGWLPKAEDTTAGRAATDKIYSGNVYSAPNAAGTGTQTFYRVNPIQPVPPMPGTLGRTVAPAPPLGGNQPLGGPQRPPAPIVPPTVTAPQTPPQATARLPAGALDVAPPGATEGGRVQDPKTGEVGIVRGGFVYPDTSYSAPVTSATNPVATMTGQ